MTALPDHGIESPAARRRPQLHFTPDSGWVNDPHGIVHLDGRYHMFSSTTRPA